jgi:hypothetical protein
MMLEKIDDVDELVRKALNTPRPAAGESGLKSS